MKTFTLAALVLLTSGCAGTLLAPTFAPLTAAASTVTFAPDAPVVATPIVEPVPVAAPTLRPIPTPTPTPAPPTVVPPPANPISNPPEHAWIPQPPCPEGWIEVLLGDGSMGCREVPPALVCPIGTHPVLGPDGLVCEP